MSVHSACLNVSTFIKNELKKKLKQKKPKSWKNHKAASGGLSHCCCKDWTAFQVVLRQKKCHYTDEKNFEKGK